MFVLTSSEIQWHSLIMTNGLSAFFDITKSEKKKHFQNELKFPLKNPFIDDTNKKSLNLFFLSCETCFRYGLGMRPFRHMHTLYTLTTNLLKASQWYI